MERGHDVFSGSPASAGGEQLQDLCGKRVSPPLEAAPQVSGAPGWGPRLCIKDLLFFLVVLDPYHLSIPPAILCFFAVLGFELRAYTLSHSTSPFL
jgi:hypothetical protein